MRTGEGAGGARGLALGRCSDAVAVAVAVTVICDGVTFPVGLYVQPNQPRKLLVLWDVIKLLTLFCYSMATKIIFFLNLKIPFVILSSVPWYLVTFPGIS